MRWAQYERALIQKRVNAGLKAAALRGRRGGRPRAIDQEKLAAIRSALDAGISKAAACRTFGVKRTTLIQSLKRNGIVVKQAFPAYIEYLSQGGTYNH